jgi:hypothetical protein
MPPPAEVVVTPVIEASTASLITPAVEPIAVLVVVVVVEGVTNDSEPPS